ncbi:MAG: 30S ribosomal protein S2 [Candidatus Kapabacteria bacterium]|nr:30S ribosomal protein S2 [Candidatus Kapabacteria bacterium]MDW7997180.1 30S ribosomal protein S2 [Bacteroidota bacterium]MDW8226015.1 30S ribosomal protein S2 [Bacteroidota bacterium]
MEPVAVEQLIQVGAHFGHLARRWNPKMRPFIFAERNGIHIIDVRKTQALLEVARAAVVEATAQGKFVLFVGTKAQAKNIIRREAERCGMPYVVERWLGGTLTNFSTIRQSIRRLATIDKWEADGTLEQFTKKERLQLLREREKLRTLFGGIEQMNRLPGMLYIVDIVREHIAVKEAHILGIPTVGIVDTNADPEAVNYPIPANDDSVATIDLFTRVVADAVIEGRHLARQHGKDLEALLEGQEQKNEPEAGLQRRRRLGESTDTAGTVASGTE